MSWNHSTFDCMSNCGNCICGTCCSCCMIYLTAEKVQESGLLCSLLSCFCTPIIPIYMFRSKIRERYGIEGSSGGDCCCACCCPCCTLIQVANEADSRANQK
eukprot:TRINITY_DN11685_c0_g1_i1.p1 TRINITY_DN11685_c0_g1~~TRINITY_DN11685_c0_g1_i1.p1  ORF type:complete len:102 (-),score=7.91 TRINITY_DN11685_c0_g1_i1:175-480(-)